MDLTVVIITLNEEFNIYRCLSSIPKGCEIIVVDSGSQDRTVELCHSFGAKVFSNDFVDYASQKNFGISKSTRSWILSLDADEELSSGASDGLVDLISKGKSDISGYKLRRRLIFMGKTMNWGKTRDAPLRLFLRDKAEFHGAVHEKVILREGRVKTFSVGYISHYSYKDLHDYFLKFNKYTSLLSDQKAEINLVVFSAHLLRPFFEFFVRYVIRLGFLDGYPGYVYALNSSMYAFTKYSKSYEKRFLG